MAQIMQTIDEIPRIARRIGRWIKWTLTVVAVASLAFVVLQVIDTASALASIHPVLGYAFAALGIAATAVLIGWPAWKMWRLPRVTEPPDFAQDHQLASREQLLARTKYLGRYLQRMTHSEAMADSRGEIEAAVAQAQIMAQHLKTTDESQLAQQRTQLQQFEAQRFNPLLVKIDQQVDALIRREAVQVGVATAVMPLGIMDAFIVLWRNVNMVSRIARMYYGRPGLRGTAVVMRDVAGATVLATYLENITELVHGVAQQFITGWAAAAARPVVEGSVNAVATLRIGHLAKMRCRTLTPWKGKQRILAVKAAFDAAGSWAGDVLREVSQRVGGSLGLISQTATGAVKQGADFLSDIWRRVSGMTPPPTNPGTPGTAGTPGDPGPPGTPGNPGNPADHTNPGTPGTGGQPG